MMKNRRDFARKHFLKCGLSYKDIGLDEINVLVYYLNKNIENYKSYLVEVKEPVLKGKYKNIVLDSNKKIKFAELRVKGTYFDDREAITFNEDGWIGFCGWADMQNLTPFVMGFIEWCNFLKDRKCSNE